MNNVLNVWRKSVRFGPYIPLSNIILTYGRGRFFPESFYRRLFNRRNRKIRRILNRMVGDVVRSGSEGMGEYDPSAPVWFCWLQGEDNMPAVVRLCLSSIRKNANGHPVRVVTLANYSDYVKLPPHILDAYACGRLKNAHFADILRVYLLAECGGLWIDSTMYVCRPLDEELFCRPFFSIKTAESGYFVSRCRWSVFCLGGWAGNPLYRKVSECFSEYLKRTSVFVDYFMFDQFISMIYDEDAALRRMIDSVPFNNAHVHDLSKLLGDRYDAETYASLTCDTSMFKLNWRTWNDARLSSLEGTYYNHLCENDA